MGSDVGELARIYVTERRQRGEIGDATAGDLLSRLQHFARHVGPLPLDELDADVIEDWIGSVGHYRPASRRAYVSTVKVFCRWLVRHRIIERDPTEDIGRVREPRTVPRALPAAKVARLLASRPAPRDQVILWLMVGIALRCAEVAGARIEDYDVDAGTLFVRGKGANERVLPVPIELAQPLEAWLGTVRRSTGPLVESATRPGRHMTPEAVSSLVTSWMYRCGVKDRPHDGVTPHALRHTAASDALERSGDLRVIQELLGHANLATTSRYLRCAGLDKMRRAVEGRRYLAAI